MNLAAKCQRQFQSYGNGPHMAAGEVAANVRFRLTEG
jgi:hypothetical protein